MSVVSHRHALLVLFLITSAHSVCAQEILKHEPQLGTLRPGMAVYVDNGRCPAGQVMEVTAGTFGNRNGHAQPRGRRCVPRP